MARRRRSSSLHALSDINITPLMDLTFVLLIVFMITAPMLEYSVDVSPPQMNAEEPEEDNSVVVTLNAKGDILFEEQKLVLAALRDRLTALRDTRADVAVLIRADEGRPYGEVVGIMKTVRAARIDDVSLLTQAED